jgi:hypothetical protein
MALMTDQIMVTISAAAGGAISEMRQLESSTTRAGTSADTAGGKFKSLGKSITAGLVAGAAALVGTQLVQFLNDSVDAYANSAKAAGDLAEATGGTVEEVSRMQAALQDAGVSADQSANLLTKFTTNAQKNTDLLAELNVEMVKGADGNIDYAATMVLAVDAIGDIGDASRRNQALVELFGKAGATAFQDLYASGVDLADAMEAISKYRVFTSDDVRRAVAYDDAMDGLNASVQSVQFGLGKALVPMLSNVAGAFAMVIEAINPFLAILAEIPQETIVMVAGFTALNAILKSTFAANAVSMIASWAAQMVTGFVAVGTGAVSMSGVVRGAMASMSAALLANPVTAVLVAVAAGLALVQAASKNANDEIAEFMPRMKELEDQGYSTADALNKTAEEWESSASAWDKFSMGMENYGWLKAATGVVGTFVDVIDGADEPIDNFKDKMSDAREEMGEFAWAGGMAEGAQKGLNDSIAEFLSTGDLYSTTWADVKTAAESASIATLDQKQATELAEIATLAYSGSLQDQIEWHKRLIGIGPSVEDALNGIQSAYQTLGDTTDDPATWGDEYQIQAGKAQQAIWDTVAVWAESGMSTQEIVVQLEGIKDKPGATDKTRADVDEVIAAIQGTENEIPVNIQALLDPGSAATATAGIDAITGPKTTDVTINVANNAGAKATIDAVAEPRTSDVDIDITNDAGAKSILDDVAKKRTVPYMIDILNDKGAGSILDNLVRKRIAPIEVDITNDQGADSVLNNLARKRTAVIEVDVRGVNAAKNEIASITSASLNQYKQPDFTIPQPINVVKVSVDGKQLKAIIRDELGYMRESDDYTAALGVML